MKQRKLGYTDLNLTTIGFGAWAIGGPDYAFGWGPQDDEESVAGIHRAVDAGINWIDTAAVYGLGHSERIVARALTSLGSSRRPYVFTKCSLVWDEQGSISHNLKAASVRKELEDSLRRLETEVIRDKHEVTGHFCWTLARPVKRQDFCRGPFNLIPIWRLVA